MRTASGDRDSPGVMTPVPSEDDFEEALRRALQQAADCVEASGDGLTRIFRRLAAPWLVRQVSLLLTDCVDLLELTTIWLQPMSARTRAVPAAAKRSVREAFQRCTSPGWLRTAVAWLRPALAAAATAVIVMTGTVALSQTVARIELSSNRPAGISLSAGTATGSHQQPVAGGGPGHVRKTSPTTAGGPTHQHSCAASRCSSGQAGASAPGPSMQPTAAPTGNAPPAPKPKQSHRHHQPQSHHHQPNPPQQHYRSYDIHHHDWDPAGVPGY
jgi:hypothetical protein